jgi:hypothetical protein
MQQSVNSKDHLVTLIPRDQFSQLTVLDKITSKSVTITLNFDDALSLVYALEQCMERAVS